MLAGGSNKINTELIQHYYSNKKQVTNLHKIQHYYYYHYYW